MLLLLLLGHFSPVWLCATPWTAAHRALLSTEFSRQEYWSGLPFPLQLLESGQFSRWVMSDSLRPMNRSMPGLPVYHQLPEITQIHVHRAGDAIQPSHPLSSPFPPAPNPSQHQSPFQWVNYSHEVAKVLEFSFSISPYNKYSGLISFKIE